MQEVNCLKPFNQKVEDLPDDDSRKIYLLRIIEKLISSGGEDNEWQIAVKQESFKKRLKDWQEMRTETRSG